jgi:selenocysteine-specific elongation factor
VQLILDKPIGALRGDRFILRDQSAMRTLGGGIVIDPLAPSTRRASAMRTAELAAFQETDPAAALARLMQAPQYVLDLRRFETLYNLVPQRTAELLQARDVVTLGKERPLGITRERHAAIQQAVLAALAEFHRAQPQAPGLDVEALRVRTAAQLPPEAFLAVLRELGDARKLEVASNLARLPGHNATANSADEKLWQIVRPALEAAGYNPPPVKDLALQLKVKEPILRDFLHRKAKGGDVQKVTAERFYARSTLAALAAIAQNTSSGQPNGLFTAAQYRDATGVGRSLAIEILEHLDRLGITQRLGDARKMRRDPVPILGEALPLEPRPAAAARPGPAKPAGARPPVQGRPYPQPRKR